MATTQAVITMSMREADRLKTIQAVAQRCLRVGQAAERLGMSRRQVERLLVRYRSEGAVGVVSKQRGQPSHHQLVAGLAERALQVIRERYADFGPTLACEKLLECHGLRLSKETVRRLMSEAGMWKPRRQRRPEIHQPRNRRACYGELIQIDGSDHRWFEDRAPACTLLVFVDDATSRLMVLYFAPTETTFAYFEAMRAYLQRYGKPMALYSDKASVFRPTRESEMYGQATTQFGRALFELNVDTFCANSSQAKGRVERANLTLQDRLVKELRLHGISSMEAANDYVVHFMADYNGRFGKPPRSTHDAHRPLRAEENLEEIFTWRVPRKVSQQLTLQHEKRIYLLADTPANQALIHRYIDFWEYPDGQLEIRADGRSLPYERYDRLSVVENAAVVENKRLGRALEVAQAMQAQRDDWRRSSASRTHRGEAANANKVPRKPGFKPQRSLTQGDLKAAIDRVCSPPLAAAGAAPPSPLKPRKAAPVITAH